MTKKKKAVKLKNKKIVKICKRHGELTADKCSSTGTCKLCVAIWSRRYYRKHKAKHKAYSKRYQENATKNLTDAYVRSVLRKSGKKTTPTAIKKHREQLKAKRKKYGRK